VPAEQWIACSAGQAAKGRRLCDWTRVELAVARARAASEQASETAKHYSIARMAPSLSSRS
jgi:hypothetical protein